ncbi:hypothetical protein ACFXAZ_19830 [Streptomyces sp. NPDC059477]|uniref:hypothetical protein n=1 Tax=Streptomyces sp. NPDC059477 TaxID=3346847 RepID=UPI0036BB851E
MQLRDVLDDPVGVVVRPVRLGGGVDGVVPIPVELDPEGREELSGDVALHLNCVQIIVRRGALSGGDGDTAAVRVRANAVDGDVVVPVELLNVPFPYASSSRAAAGDVEGGCGLVVQQLPISYFLPGCGRGGQKDDVE